MPKFNLKDVGKRVMRHSRDEGLPLVSSPTTGYGQSGQRHNSTSGEMDRPDRRSVSSLPRSPSSSSGLNPDVPTVKIRPGMSPPASPKVTAEMDVDFEAVPFQFYRQSGDNWKASFFQSTALIVLCLFCPSLFMFCFWIGSSSYSANNTNQKKQSEGEKKKLSYLWISLCSLTFTKDMIVIAVIMQSYFKTEASSYIVAYSPIVFCWFLVLFVFPITLFYFADVRYEFGLDADKKKLLKVFSAYFFNNRTKSQQSQKVTAQETYFNEKYDNLSKVQTAMDELKFLYKVTSKRVIVSSIILSAVTCIVHAIIPCLLQLNDYTYDQVVANNRTLYNRTLYNESMSNYTTDNNITRPSSEMYIVIGISTYNSLVVALLSAPYFVYVILWKMSMLREWRRFNENENSSSTTLVNSGPQGIAMWWKIRQTLKFFSNSDQCLSAMVGRMACVVAMIFVSLLSVIIIKNVISLESHFSTHYLIPLMMDNILLYGALLFMGALSVLNDSQKRMSKDIIELKQLNISYELGQLMNLEQDAIETEPGVKVKVRVMRGCLMLLQELTSTMENLEKGTSSRLTMICFVVSTILILPSTGLGFRYLIAMGA